MTRCLVKTNGKRCPNEADKSRYGQCGKHHRHFIRMIRENKMTWAFLEASGEAILDPKTENLRSRTRKKK